MRRSGRQRKSVVKFQDEPDFQPRKRRAASLSDHEGMDQDVDEPEDESEGESDDGDFDALKRKRQPVQRAKPRPTGPLTGDFRIADDNVLFEAVRHGNTALQLTVDEWVQSYLDSQDKGQPMADLVNFVLRCCGCNGSVDGDQVLDLDAATDYLDAIQDAFQRKAPKEYPLIAKSKTLKRFRTSLAEFLSRLIQNAHTSEILYDDVFCEAFQTWLAAATSSRLRSFRHTTTVIALDFITALCQVAVEVADEFNKATRQRDAEAQKPHADKKRLAVMEENVHEAHQQKVKLEEYLKDMFDGVFVHRYRDAEPSIRCECVHGLGQWMQIYPEHYLDGDHLRYLGWNLTDISREARLEAVTSLEALYAKPEQLGSLQHFTERFKGRLVEMACAEPDLAIRRAALASLKSITTHGLLEDAQRTDLAKLLFHLDVKVRQSVAPYYAALIQEAVDEQLNEGAIADKDDETALVRLWYKSAASLLAEHSSLLGTDHTATDDGQTPKMLLLHKPRAFDTRIALAVDALWPVAEQLHQWETLANYLLLDHSRSADPESSKQLEAALCLDEYQESTLAEILAATLRAHKSGIDKAKDQEDRDAELTRSLMPIVPRLLEKYGGESSRALSVLQIPPIMNMELYLDMRAITELENLWDLITRIVLQSSDEAVLSQAMLAISHVSSFIALGETNTSKTGQLIQQAMTGIRQSVQNRDVATASFSTEEVESLTAWMARLHLLSTQFDTAAQLEDNGGLKYTSVYAVVDAISERGMLGSMEEQKLTVYAIETLFCYFGWSLNRYLSAVPPTKENAAALFEVRDVLLQRFQDLAVGVASSATGDCRRAAFNKLLQMHMLISQTPNLLRPPEDQEPTNFLRGFGCDLADEVQFRCAGFLEAEIQQFASEIGANVFDQMAQGDEDSDHDEAREGTVSTAPAGKISSSGPHSFEQLQAEYSFNEVVSNFVKGLVLGVVQLRHASHLLAQVGRLGHLFDECTKYLVDFLRDEGLYEGSVVTVISVLQDTFDKALELVGDGYADDAYLTQLFRTLTPCFLARGHQANVNKKLPAKDIGRLLSHTAAEIIAKCHFAGQSADSKAKQTRLLKSFKPFEKLVAMIDSTDALAVQKRVEHNLEQHNVRVSGDKKWDPYRSFIKKLSGKVAKDPAIVRAAKRVKQASLDGSAGDQDAQASKKISRKTTEPPTRKQPRRTAINVHDENRAGSHDRIQERDQDNSEDQDTQPVSPRFPNSPSAKPTPQKRRRSLLMEQPPEAELGGAGDALPTEAEASAQEELENGSETGSDGLPRPPPSQASLSTFRRHKRAKRSEA